MKKLILIILFFLSHTLVDGQAQRLAMLPYTMKLIDDAGRSYLPTLCVDYFNDVPKGTDTYSAIGSDVGDVKFSTVNKRFDKIKITDVNGKRTTPHLSQTAYLAPGGNSEALPTSYTDFIDARTAHYKIGGFTQAKQKALQNDVWAYDIMNKLGYMDPNISDATARFGKAKEAFKGEILSTSGTVKNDEIVAFGGILKLHVHDSKFGAGGPLIIKNSSGQYVVFTDVAPPIYRGTSEAELTDALNSDAITAKTVITTLGFENETKAKAFQLDLKSRFDAKYSKDISFVDNDAFKVTSYLMDQHNYQIIRNFDRTQIAKIGDDYHADMAVQTRVNGADVVAEIDASSNDRGAITPFFTGIVNKIRSAGERFQMLVFLKNLRRSVISRLGPNTNLTAMITDELGAKVLVEIEGGKLVDTYYYASK
jgi:hypothetical protein